MAETHVLSALIRKRAEIAGQIEHTQDTLRQHVIDLDNLDATIRLFDPEIDLDEIKPKPLPLRHNAYKGQVSRIVLEALRLSDRSLTSSELAQHVMAHRDMNTADKPLVRLIGKRVGGCLRYLRGRGLVKSEKGFGLVLVWEIRR